MVAAPSPPPHWAGPTSTSTRAIVLEPSFCYSESAHSASLETSLKLAWRGLDSCLTGTCELTVAELTDVQYWLQQETGKQALPSPTACDMKRKAISMDCESSTRRLYMCRPQCLQPRQSQSCHSRCSILHVHLSRIATDP